MLGTKHKDSKMDEQTEAGSHRERMRHDGERMKVTKQRLRDGDDGGEGLGGRISRLE